MAAKKLRGKQVSVSTETGVIKTGCKSLFNPIWIGNEFKGKCLTCHKRKPELAKACAVKVMAAQEKAKEKAKASAKVGSKTKRPWCKTVTMVNNGKPAREICQWLESQGLTESQAKDFQSAIRCCWRAFVGLNVKGKVYEYAKYLVYGGVDPTPKSNVKTCTGKVLDCLADSPDSIKIQ